MRSWPMLLVLAAAGCDSMFGLDGLYECPLDDDDCDRLLDRVDPCPADPGTDADEDADGVGDDCDPNRGMPTDRLLDFDGFTAHPERWTARGTASFDIHGSELALDAGAVERAVAANSQPTVEVVLDPTFTADGDTVGAYVASKSSTGIPLECRVEHHAAGDDLVMLLGDPSSGTPAEVARATMLPGSPKDGLRIYGGQLASFKIRCRARYGTSDGLYVDWDLFRAPADFDTVGLRVQKQARADCRSVTIFTTVPP